MIWQDWVITFVQCWFIISLVPTIRDPEAKPPLSTSVPTTLGVAVMAFCMFTLSMWASGFLLSILAVLWGVIARQRFDIDMENTYEPRVSSFPVLAPAE